LEDATDLSELAPDDSTELAEALAADPRLQRGLELWRLGRFEEAKVELKAMHCATAYDALAQYQLALVFRDIGLYRSSILSIVGGEYCPVGSFYSPGLIGLADLEHPIDAPAFIARLAYPTYYEDLVLQNAELSDLDPLLVFSTIRQESNFESFATSVAAAHGLMQVIPETGAWIAAQIGWPPGYQTADLYRPYVSLRFGTYYLAQQRDRFDGRLDAALAGYNGGPNNAQRWLEAAEGDPDLLLELITFSETRAYLQRIKEHLAVYEALYGG
jgi:soluble lytic murein transglycosylase